jgi:UDP-glucuronate decarboxylase
MESSNAVTGPINLGNPNEFTILELAQKIISESSSDSKILFGDLPLDDPKQRKPDINLARSILGWEPEIQLNDGLKETVKYFSARLQELNSDS